MIIGLTGQLGSGKDTVGAYFVQKYGFTRIAFADKLKNSAAACFGIDRQLWEELKNDPTCLIQITREVPTPWYGVGMTGVTGVPYSRQTKSVAFLSAREFLQNYGTEAHRQQFGYNFWVEQALKDIDVKNNYVITDVRFDNEAESVIDYGGMILKVDRNVGSTGDHISEAGISPHLINGVISNNGTLENLYHRIDAFIGAFASDLHN